MLNILVLTSKRRRRNVTHKRGCQIGIYYIAIAPLTSRLNMALWHPQTHAAKLGVIVYLTKAFLAILELLWCCVLCVCVRVCVCVYKHGELQQIH